MYVTAIEAIQAKVFPCLTFCDGKRIKLCCGYDLEAGYADTIKTKGNTGQQDDIIINRAKGVAEKERHYGVITFKSRNHHDE